MPDRTSVTVASRTEDHCQQLRDELLRVGLAVVWGMGKVQPLQLVWGKVFIARLELTDSVMSAQAHLETTYGVKVQHVFAEGADMDALFPAETRDVSWT